MGRKGWIAREETRSSFQPCDFVLLGDPPNKEKGGVFTILIYTTPFR
jgi:hypothetical protein